MCSCVCMWECVQVVLGIRWQVFISVCDCVHSSSTQSGKTRDKSTSKPSQKEEEKEKEGEEKEGEEKEGEEKEEKEKEGEEKEGEEKEGEEKEGEGEVETVGPSQEDYDKLQEGQQVTAVYKLHCSKALAHRQ